MSRKKSSPKKKSEKNEKLPREIFDRELEKLQVELCHLQDYVKTHGLKVVVIFEGRDAAGKGGVIKRITERVSPRVFRVVALPAPSDREKTQWYFQRYVQHLPAAGEIILFDRSWYNRAGVERVMGFCTSDEYDHFMLVCPGFERELIRSGIILIKYFFDVTQEEQEHRFLARANDPKKHWKLSPMDVESWRRWWDYTRCYELMLEATDTNDCPWYRVPADDKRRARLNCISHLLSQIPYKKMKWKAPEMDKRNKRKPGTPDTMTFHHEVPQKY